MGILIGIEIQATRETILKLAAGYLLYRHEYKKYKTPGKENIGVSKKPRPYHLKQVIQVKFVFINRFCAENLFLKGLANTSIYFFKL